MKLMTAPALIEEDELRGAGSFFPTSNRPSAYEAVERWTGITGQKCKAVSDLLELFQDLGMPLFEGKKPEEIGATAGVLLSHAMRLYESDEYWNVISNELQMSADIRKQQILANLQLTHALADNGTILDPATLLAMDEPRFLEAVHDIERGMPETLAKPLDEALIEDDFRKDVWKMRTKKELRTKLFSLLDQCRRKTIDAFDEEE